LKDSVTPNDVILVGEDVRVVKVIGDGSCFFLSVVVHGISLLNNAARSPSGLIKDTKLRLLEATLAVVRQEVCAILTKESHSLTQLAEDFPFILENDNGKHYKSIDERVKRMASTGNMLGIWNA